MLVDVAEMSKKILHNKMGEYRGVSFSQCGNLCWNYLHQLEMNHDPLTHRLLRNGEIIANSSFSAFLETGKWRPLTTIEGKWRCFFPSISQFPMEKLRVWEKGARVNIF